LINLGVEVRIILKWVLRNINFGVNRIELGRFQ
jgi:hypothetical protein